MLQSISCRNWLRPTVRIVSRHNNHLLLHHTQGKPVQRHVLLRSFRSNASHQNLSPGPTLQATPFDVAGGPIPLGNILKALVFTGTFCVGTFMGATILEYENTRSMMLKKAKQISAFSWLRRQAVDLHQNSWESLKTNLQRHWDGLNPGEKVFAPICAINLIVFGMWRVPSLRKTMMTYFCSNPAGRAVCWPMVLSTFSHYSAFHLFANMYVLHSFSNAAVLSLGKEQFAALYLSAGVIASMSSILYKAAISQAGLSLGASGAIMAILAYVCTQYPDTQLSILFLPMLTFSAGSAIKVIMGIDLAGCIMGWKFFDHAAHLGGAAFGVFWAYFGMQLWQKRMPFLNMYHDWRKTK